MATILVTTRDGAQHEVPASPGLSLMQIVRDARIADMVALCGGTLSFATCHVYLDQRDVERLPRRLTTRNHAGGLGGAACNLELACQGAFDSAPRGIRIVMAP